ncbi:OmpA family protein [Desulfobacter curvatus]|uniref:OmpA family protein n=1 Tax=Desulfobacter curvatus TaxID=2290 RepID=UPI00036F699C|nr:OmpA family protein [Desulfobacter curvatus]
MIKQSSTITGLYFIALMICAISGCYCISVQPAAAASQGCQQAKLLYDQAMDHSDNQEKIRLLEQAADICPSFDIYFQLGNVFGEEKRYSDARMAYKDAQLSTDEERLQANALIMIGGTYEAQEDMQPAIRYFRLAQEIHENPKVEAHLQDLFLSQAGEFVSQDNITRALTESTRSLKGFSACPKIDLYIHFDLGSYALSRRDAQQQSVALGRALKDKALQGSRILIIGHTDSQGEESYNMALSMKRAESVKHFLIRHYPELTSHLTLATEGKGETRLLVSPETTDRHYAANRRVEVVVQCK